MPSARHMNRSGSCRRRSKFCFGHFPTNFFLLLLSGSTTSALVHQELHRVCWAWGFLWQALGLEAGGHDWATTICLCFSDASGACGHVIAISCERVKKSIVFPIYPEDKSQCALQAMPTWKRVSVTSREAPFPGDISSWGYNRRQNLRLLGTSFGCSFF